MGSAALFFSAKPARAILSDLNQELVSTFLTVRRAPHAVAAVLATHSNSRREYYRVRSQPVERLSSVERAARFIYLNRFCFNGLYRTNTQGKFNVPYGRPKNDNRPTDSALTECAQLLRRATVCAGDFQEIVATNVRSGDLVYLDPPYAVTKRRIFKEYSEKSFDAADLERLDALVHLVDSRGATFVLSYAYCSGRACIRRIFV
jgi:DNA adenine methylase